MEWNSIMEHKILEQIEHIDDTICHDKKQIKELEMQLEKLNEEYNKKCKRMRSENHEGYVYQTEFKLLPAEPLCTQQWSVNTSSKISAEFLLM